MCACSVLERQCDFPAQKADEGGWLLDGFAVTSGLWCFCFCWRLPAEVKRRLKEGGKAKVEDLFAAFSSVFGKCLVDRYCFRVLFPVSSVVPLMSLAVACLLWEFWSDCSATLAGKPVVSR